MTLRHCLHIYLCRSTAVRFQDFGGHTPRPSLGVVGAVQALAWPKSCLYVTIKPTETRTRSIPVAGTLTALLDVLQTLDLGSHQWRCNSLVCAVARSKLQVQLFFSVARPLGFSCGFSPTSVCVPSTRVCSRVWHSTRSHQAGRSQGSQCLG